MKENEFKKGIEDIKKFKLDEKEKGHIFRFILNAPVVSPYAPRRSFWEVSISWVRVARIGAAVFLLFSVGTVTAFRAENSLPGDRLYALKVGFNEPIRDLVSVTKEEQAKWESQKAARRIEEAVDLAAQGKLNEKNRIELEERFNKHTDNFTASVSETASSSPRSNLIELRFEADVSAKVDVLEKFEKRRGKSNEEDKDSEKEELKKFKEAVSKKMEERTSGSNSGRGNSGRDRDRD